jgi:hypothetical protein
MSHPQTRLSRSESERLLDAPAHHDNALGWALSAAAAPAHPGELRREEAAVAAFHDARMTPSLAARSGYVSPRRLGSRAATQAVVATAAVLALGSGSFALAGSIDLPDLPGLPDQASDRATEAVSQAPRSGGATGAPTTEESDDVGDDRPSGPSSVEPTESAESSETAETAETSSPTPSFRGLCTAYQATDRAAHGKSLDSAAFTALATEAGGADRIATYCVDLIGPPKVTGRPTDRPTPTAKPGNPNKPTDQPSGRPTDKPDHPHKPDHPNKPDKPETGQGGNGTHS